MQFVGRFYSVAPLALLAILPDPGGGTEPPGGGTGGGGTGSVAEKVDVSTVAKTTTAISNVANALGVVLFALAAIFILIAGFFYLTAAGNQTQLDKAKNTLIYAIVGIVLGLIAFSVPALVKNFLA